MVTVAERVNSALKGMAPTHCTVRFALTPLMHTSQCKSNDAVRRGICKGKKTACEPANEAKVCLRPAVRHTMLKYGHVQSCSLPSTSAAKNDKVIFYLKLMLFQIAFFLASILCCPATASLIAWTACWRPFVASTASLNCILGHDVGSYYSVHR